MGKERIRERPTTEVALDLQRFDIIGDIEALMCKVDQYVSNKGDARWAASVYEKLYEAFVLARKRIE